MGHFPKSLVSQHRQFCRCDSDQHVGDCRHDGETRQQVEHNQCSARYFKARHNLGEELWCWKADALKSTCAPRAGEHKLLDSFGKKLQSYQKTNQNH